MKFFGAKPWRSLPAAWALGFAIFAIWPLAASAAEVFGTIELSEGVVSVVDAQGQSRLVQAMDKIMEGDTIVTGRNGEVHVRTEDHGYIAVRNSTKFRVDAYSAHADKDDKSVTSLLVGTVRSITGWIGKYTPEAYAIKTPSVTIGVRGTDHEPNVILPPEPGEIPVGPPGTYDKVNQGSTVMRSDKGSVVLERNQAGFAAPGAAEAPRTLDAIPAFYKPSRREARIDRRKEALAQNMEQRHEAKAKQRSQQRSQQPAKKAGPAANARPPKQIGPRAKAEPKR